MKQGNDAHLNTAACVSAEHLIFCDFELIVSAKYVLCMYTCMYEYIHSSIYMHSYSHQTIAIRLNRLKHLVVTVGVCVLVFVFATGI